MHEGTKILLVRTLHPIRGCSCILHWFAVGVTNGRERDQRPKSPMWRVEELSWSSDQDGREVASGQASTFPSTFPVALIARVCGVGVGKESPEKVPGSPPSRGLFSPFI